MKSSNGSKNYTLQGSMRSIVKSKGNSIAYKNVSNHLYYRIDSSVKTIDTLKSVGNHWATKYIGKPCVPGCKGPLAFDCWGLVTHIQEHIFERSMPSSIRVSEMTELKTPNQWLILRTLISKSQWQKVDDSEKPVESDIALMRSDIGPHVGVVIYANGNRGILHAFVTKGTSGSVIFTKIDKIYELGFSRVDYFRFTEQYNIDVKK